MDDDTASVNQPAGETPSTQHAMGARRALVITVLFFVVQIGFGIVVGVGAGVYVVISRRTADPVAMADVIGLVALPASIVGVAFGGFVALWMARRTFPGPIRDGALAPLGWTPSAASDIAKGGLAGCVLALVYLFVLVPFGPSTEGRLWGPLATSALSGGWQRHLWAALALVLAPPIEEFVFRGVLLGGLSNKLGIRTAGIIVTLVFVLVHASETLGYWPAWVGVALLASAALLVRLRTRSLMPAIGVHAGYNLCLVITVYAGAALQ